MRAPVGSVVGGHPLRKQRGDDAMGKGRRHTPERDDRKGEGPAPAPAPPDAQRPGEEAEAASGVPCETEGQAVEQAVRGVHG